MEKGFLENSELAKYEQLSNTYLITKSPSIVDEMYENFKASDIYTWEDNAVILYNLAKKYPATFKDAPEIKREYIIMELKDEFKAYSGLMETVEAIVHNMNVETADEYRDDIIELCDIAIQHMRSQGFETVPYIITSTNIMTFCDKLMEIVENASVEYSSMFMRTVITNKNYSYIIENLCSSCLKDREPDFKKMIYLIGDAINAVDELPEDVKEDEENDDYNPLYDMAMSKEEMLKLAYDSIDFTMVDLDKVNQIRCITAIRDVMTDIKEEDTLHRICMKMIEPFLKSIADAYNLVAQRKESPASIIKDMQEIDELEYRLPRVLYLSSGEFEILEPLYEIILITEMKVLKDLQIIEQQHSLRMCSEALLPEATYVPYLKIDMETLAKIVPIEYNDEMLYDKDILKIVRV